MAIEPLTHVQLFTNSEPWSGCVSSPRGMLIVEISEAAQGDRGLAVTELSMHLWAEWSINVPLDFVETEPGVWTAALPN